MKRLKSLLFIMLMLVCSVTNGQEAHKLRGRITDCKYKKPIGNIVIKLLCQDSRIFEVKSDSLGFYFFNDSVLKPNLAYVLSTISPNEYEKIPFGTCPYSYFKNGYLNSSDKVKFKAEENISAASLVYDFCLVPIERSIIFPTVFFEKNSTEFAKNKVQNYDYYFHAGDTLVDCLVDLMKNYPEYVFHLDGHADKKEKKSKELAELRVKKVYDILVKSGVQKDRIYTKSWGSKEPTEDKDMNGMVVGRLYGAINQRVVVSVLRKDYNQKKAATIIQNEEED